MTFEANEHRERAEQAAEAGDPYISRVSITIAFLAVAAAVVGSLETVESSSAIKAASEAVLYQDRATDTWNEYQSDSLKKHIYGIAADQGGANAARYKKTAADQAVAQKTIQAKAKQAEADSAKLVEASEAHERRHHWLTGAATLLEIGIGISTVAIITRRRSFWYGALALGFGGAALFAVAFLL